VIGVLAACVALGASHAPSALASHNQVVFFEAGNELLDPATRAKALTQMQTLGVKAIRVELYWANVAPDANDARRPSFDATDPSSYHWGEYDTVLAEAQRRKWQVLLTVASPVPRWATANGKAPYVTRPDDLEFQEFMTAVGRHYASEVSLFAIWNEPNQLGWLLPQFNSNGTPASPRIYRGLFQAGYAGLEAAGIAHPRVLIGETAPFGYSRVDARSEGLRHNVSPLAFLRGMLCLDANYRKAATCGELKPYGYADHPYTLPAGPFYRPANRDDVTIGTLARLTGALAAAARVGALPARLPVYLTEFGFNTKPNPLGVSPAQQAQYDAICERIAWEDPAVAAFSQYELRDDSIPRGTRAGFIGFQTGLETARGQLEPLFYGFPVPLTVTREARGYALWGLVRPAGEATTLTVLIRRPGSATYLPLRSVRTNSLGYWTLRSTVAAVSWRVRWVSPAGAIYEGPPIAAY
jgi:Cellulase (glycosyl hydrolase family 5)